MISKCQGTKGRKALMPYRMMMPMLTMLMLQIIVQAQHDHAPFVLGNIKRETRFVGHLIAVASIAFIDGASSIGCCAIMIAHVVDLIIRLATVTLVMHRIIAGLLPSRPRRRVPPTDERFVSSFSDFLRVLIQTRRPLRGGCDLV
jgi:hypothetical protein